MTPDGGEQFAVYAVRFAHRDASLRGEHFYRGDPCGDHSLPIDYFVWAAVSRDVVVLVDAGFTAETAARRGGRQYLRSPVDTLRSLGVDPAAVGHLVITHLHYDHVGHVADFPAAEVLLQRAEYDFWTSPMAERGEYPHLTEPADLAYLGEQLRTGRLKLVEGERTVVPGITLHHVGGHTPGLQVVRVATARGHVVLASDATHFYENIEADRPYSIVDHLPSMYVAFDTVRELADGDDLVVPGHDPLVLDRFPCAGEGLEGLAVRVA